MINLSDQTTDAKSQSAKQARRAFNIAIATAVLMALACLYNVYTALFNQDYLSVAITAIIAIVAVIAAWLCRRGQVTVGIVLLISVFCGLMALAPLSVAGMGIMFAVMVIVLSTGIALATLPPVLAGRMIGLGFLVGFIIVLLDLFGPAGRPTPSNPIASTVVVIFLVVVYSLIMARQFANFNLRTKLVISFVATGMLTVAIIAVATNYLTRQSLTNNANQALLAAAQQTATTLDTFIVTNQDYLRTQAQLPVFVKYLSMPAASRSGSDLEAEVNQTLKTLAKRDPLFISSYALLDQQGIDVVDTYVADVGLNKSDRDYFVTPVQTGLPYISPARLSDTTGEFAFYISNPIRNVAGEIIGVLRVRYNAAILQQLLSQSNGLAGPESFSILLDEHHIRLADSVNPENILKSIVPLEPALLARLQAEGRLPVGTVADVATNLPDFEEGLLNTSSQPYFSSEVGEKEGEIDEVSSIDQEQVAVSTLKNQPWVLAFAQPREVFLVLVQDQTRATVLLATLITLGVVMVALGLGQFLAGPIVRLTEVARQVTAGDLEAQATIAAKDEIGQLALAFNQMTGQLRNSIGSLEEQVRDRTAELSLSMQVGQQAAAIRDLDELLPTIVEFIRRHYALYYVHIYLVDDIRASLNLRAGTGAVGQELLARNHTLPIGSDSIVGQVAATLEPIVVPNTATSLIHRPNELLPNTRSELAVPLIVEGYVIGVLDMQSDRVNTFTDDNVTVFEAMATQLAISIDSARQWAAAGEAQRRSEEALKLLTRETWAEQLQRRRVSRLGYQYNLSDIRPLADGGGNGDISAPVVVQNQPIGQLSVAISKARGATEDELSLIQAVAQQLSQKAENLRLFDETRQRATREQIAREITDRIRSSRDIETALKTTAEELGKALGTSKTVIDLRITPEND